MAKDPGKLQALVKEQNKKPGHPEPDEDDEGGPPDNDADDMEDGEDNSEEAQNRRKEDAGYMELKEDAGGFSCANCEHLGPSGSDDSAECLHSQVRAQVAPDHGFCPLFSPTDDVEIVFPGGGGGEKDEDDEGGKKKKDKKKDKGGGKKDDDKDEKDAADEDDEGGGNPFA